ncbi:DUF6891 domain-containing protein [Flavobacterium sp. FlaQc-57]|uniref:DUF6891 domain-containing protein n=1 Tax=Flavobacterium sp. FlaQc-57 TaxID=3374186 RepID=UPI0037581F11
MRENAEFIYELIYSQVRMGFFTADEIKENILQEIEANEFNEEISEEWVNEIVDEEYQQLLIESLFWDKPTDTERLINAFDELCRMNIIALHNVGYTSREGKYEVIDVEAELNNYNKFSDGYCFYHERDLLRVIALENSGLQISFQKIDNYQDIVTINVGRKIVEVLNKNNFTVVWDESSTSKIEIQNFKWQYIFGMNNRDLQDYGAVVDLILKG